MIKRSGLALVFVASTCIAMAAQSEPALLTLKVPRYTLLARQARVQGVVKVAFTLLPHAVEPTNVQVVSAHGNSMGKASEELIRNGARECEDLEIRKWGAASTPNDESLLKNTRLWTHVVF